jgi:hypothetical protein
MGALVAAVRRAVSALSCAACAGRIDPGDELVVKGGRNLHLGCVSGKSGGGR